MYIYFNFTEQSVRVKQMVFIFLSYSYKVYMGYVICSMLQALAAYSAWLPLIDYPWEKDVSCFEF